MHLQIDADQECLDSIWQWNPPGELGESGAWQIVKDLASTLSKSGLACPSSSS